jgi:hypothetical protein
MCIDIHRCASPVNATYVSALARIRPGITAVKRIVTAIMPSRGEHKTSQFPKLRTNLGLRIEAWEIASRIVTGTPALAPVSEHHHGPERTSQAGP